MRIPERTLREQLQKRGLTRTELLRDQRSFGRYEAAEPSDPGPLFCPVLKSGRLQREAGQLARLSPAAAWRICRERGLQAQIPAPAPHDLRRTWIGDLLDLGVDLATVQKMAGHASVSTTGRYDRRDRGVQRRAVALLDVPYLPPRGQDERR